MNRITSYILGQLVYSTLIATAALGSMIWMTQALRLLEIVVDGGAPLSIFFQLALLTLPTFLGLILPIALAAGILFTYNRLALDSELVITQTSGISPLRIGRPAFLLACGISFIVLSLNTVISPMTQRHLAQIQQLARGELASVLLRPGVFNDIGDKMTVYVRDRTNNGEYHGILLHDERIQDHPVTTIAERGIMVDTEQGPRVIVYQGSRQEISRKTGQVSQLNFERYAIDLKATPDQYASRWLGPEEKTMWQLIARSKDPLDKKFRGRLLSEFHMRLIGSFLPLTFCIVCLAALLLGSYNRRGQTKRIITAGVLLVGIESCVLALAKLSTRTPPLAVLLYAFVLIPFGFGWWLLRQDRLPRFIRLWRST